MDPIQKQILLNQQVIMTALGVILSRIPKPPSATDDWIGLDECWKLTGELLEEDEPRV